MKKLMMIIGMVFVAGLALFLMDGRAGADSSAPGTVGDPLATKSYVDMKVNDLASTLGSTASTSTSGTAPGAGIEELNAVYAYIDEQIEEIPSSQFVVIELEPGQKLIAGSSTELILRGGSATAITSNVDNGLSDLTDSSVGIQQNGNLINGENIPLNHLLLVPRDDGRGILATAKCWVMVKGDYRKE